MRVFVTGATGFVGRALVLRLLQADHEVVAWTRDAVRARNLLGPSVEIVESARDSLDREVARADAIVNLAGANLFDGRWTRKRKQALVASRVSLTKNIARALRAAPVRDRVLVSASAVGFYGARGNETLTEGSIGGGDFLADLCRQWEAAARSAASDRTRVVIPRIGLVLGSEGGSMARLLPLFRAGLGGRLGSGRQWMSWIHLHDLVDLIVWSLSDREATGALNATAPEPETNRDFTHQLAGALGRRVGPPAPAFALKAVLGEAASVLLTGQRVLPRKALALGFPFAYPTLPLALGQILDGGRTPSIQPATALKPMPDRPAAQYVLEQETRIGAPLGTVFPFFAEAANLALLTPTWTDFHIVDHPEGETVAGSEIVYRLRLFGVPIRWRTRIDAWEPGRRFVDCQLSGPYRLWYHEHTFEASADGAVRMVDRVAYTVPGWALGRLVNRLMVAPLLRRIFAWRAEAIQLRFDPPPPHVLDDRRVA